MKRFVFHRNWIIGLMILTLVSSIVSPFNESRDLKYNDFIPSYHPLTSLNNQTLFFKEQQTNFQAFLAKPIQLLTFRTKLLRWIDFNFNATCAQFADTLNLYAAMMAIVLFIMFYRLSKTSLEKPAASRRDTFRL